MTALVRGAGVVAAVTSAAFLYGMAGTAEAAADTQSVVFLGGTGTGVVPHTPAVGSGFVEPFAPGAASVNVRYNGALWANPHKSAATALAAISDGPTTVIGLSKGAQVARAAEGQDLNQTTNYVLIGDPDGDNGVSRRFGFSAPKHVATHDVIEVNAEYDGVSDFPDRPMNLIASANALAGWVSVHTRYGDRTSEDPLTRLSEAKVTVTANGNGTSTTRMLIPTHALPLTKPLRDAERALTGRTVITDQLDKVLRPIVDAGYSRNDDGGSA